MKEALILAAAAIAVTIGFVLFSDTTHTRMGYWGIRLDISGFALVEASKNGAQETLEAERSGTRVLITKTRTGTPEKFIDDKKHLIDSLFTPGMSPYPEVITNTVECDDRFKPMMRTADHGVIYTLFAGERFNYGVCVDDLIVYDSSYGLFDCEKKGVFEVRVFSKGTDVPERIISSFSC